MLKRSAALLISLIAVSFLQNSFSQTPDWPKTLLWRISGKDLKKPSYLFGTMHLQDKRIFNLGDSFYHHFEKAEGFAMEVDINEYIDSVINKTFVSLEEEHLRGEKEEPGGGAKKIKTGKTDTALLPPPQEVPPGVEMKTPSAKELRRARNERIKQMLMYGEMPTILDAYLYGMALKQGKWFGAVEDVKDQFNQRNELGKDMSEEEIAPPPGQLIFQLESLIKIYLNQDLNGIEEFTLNKGKTRQEDIVFNARNVKMVRSIDSLSALRSMFYAVGAAHLPGDSGIIRLLREKGYTVSPIFSTTKLAAEKYAEKLPSLSWYEINDTIKQYSIEMPGIPREYNLFGELIKMKVFVDITTLSYYMTGSTISQYEDDKLEIGLKDIAKSMARNGKTESIRKVDRNGMKAVEGILYGDGIYYRVQLAKKGAMLYIIMLGAEKRSNITTASSDKYFASFKPLVNSDEGKPADWKEFQLPDKGIRIGFPSEPKRNKALEKVAAGTGWEFTIFDCTDMVTGMYYMMQVRDIGAGRYLDGDSNYFHMFKEQLITNIKKVEKDERGLFKGFPSYRLDGIGEKDIFYKTQNINRGNRIYTLMVVGPQSKKNDPAPDRFFNSAELMTYKKADWKVYTAPDNSFSSQAAAPFILSKDDNEEDTGESTGSEMIHYISYNPLEVISYEVLKTPLPPYYWAESDSVYYESKLNGYNSYLNKILRDTITKNGNLTGREMLIEMPANNNLMKVRLFLHGDTLYTLMTFIPTQYADNENHKKFFTEFRVKNDGIPSTITVNKAEKLIAALQSKDSATWATASSAFYDANFTGKDLPVLHKALLQPYPDDSLSYGSTRQKIVNTLNNISDSSTVDYIKNNYHTLTGDKEAYKVALLNVLAGQHTAYAYAGLKDLLLNHLPQSTGNYDGISYRLNDSLLLTRQLFPELLSLVRNKFMWKDVLTSATQLLDSSMIPVEMLKPYEKDLLYHIDTLLNSGIIHAEDFSSWNYINLIHLAGKLNTPGLNASLQKISAGKDLQLKEEAVLRLYENNQPVDGKETEKLAANNEYRLSLYEGLKKMNKVSFFPLKYKTQRWFAEAELYNYDEEDAFPESMELVGERDATFDGIKQRFYLFKMNYAGEEDKMISYLGVAGPFSADGKNLATTNDVTSVDFDEEYDKKNINHQFERLLKQGEEYLKNRKEWEKKNP
jgi:uncharacterized protein YbaP (TraB family)